MLSIETIRNETDRVKKSIDDRGLTGNVDRIIELDVRRRELIAETDSLRARRNEVSGSLGRSKEKPPELIAEMRKVGSRIKQLEADLRDVVGEYDALLLNVPNIPRGRCAGGRRRRPQRRRQNGWLATRLFVRPEAPLGVGRRARHHRLPPCGQAVGLAVLHLQGQGRNPTACPHHMATRYSRQRVRDAGALRPPHGHAGSGNRQRPAP